MQVSYVPLFILHVATCIHTVGTEGLVSKWSGPCAVCWCVWSAGGTLLDVFSSYCSVLMFCWGWGFMAETCWRADMCVICGVMWIVGFCWCGHGISVLCTLGWNLTKIMCAHHRVALRALCTHLCTHSERNCTCTVTTKHINQTQRHNKKNITLCR